VFASAVPEAGVLLSVLSGMTVPMLPDSLFGEPEPVQAARRRQRSTAEQVRIIVALNLFMFFQTSGWFLRMRG